MSVAERQNRRRHRRRLGLRVARLDVDRSVARELLMRGHIAADELDDADALARGISAVLAAWVRHPLPSDKPLRFADTARLEESCPIP